MTDKKEKVVKGVRFVWERRIVNGTISLHGKSSMTGCGHSVECEIDIYTDTYNYPQWLLLIRVDNQAQEKPGLYDSLQDAMKDDNAEIRAIELMEKALKIKQYEVKIQENSSRQANDAWEGII